MDTAAASPAVCDDGIPCRRRRHGFLGHVGEGFLVGAALGSALCSVGGFFRRAPVGGRLAGAARAAVAGAPCGGVYIGAYAALLWAFEGAMVHARRRDDLWNSVAAGAAASGLLHVPLGGRTAAVSALLGAALGAATNPVRNE
ncbi:unnamed protein product [Urochloa humidicola]